MQVSGINKHGETINIPGVFSTKPCVIVSPFSLNLNDPTQTMEVGVDNLREEPPGSGKWRFTIFCATTSGNTSYFPDDDSGATDEDTWVSGPYSTNPLVDVDSIVVSGKVRSVRGDDGGLWIVRKVMTTLQVDFGSGYVDVASTVSQDLDFEEFVNFFIEYTFPSAGVWDWQVKFEAFDVVDINSNFIRYGEIEYTYQDETLNTTYPITTPGIGLLNDPADNSPAWGQITFNFSPGQTGEIYKIDYSINTLKVESILKANGIYNGGLDIKNTGSGISIFNSAEINEFGVVDNISIPNTHWSGSLENIALPGDDPTKLRLSVRISKFYNSSLGADLKLNMTKPITAKVYRRNPIINSPTPDNRYHLQQAEFTQSSRVLYETGTAQWLVVGA